MKELQVVDMGEDRRFRQIANQLGYDPEDQWIGGYVAYEWSHGRHLLRRFLSNIHNKDVLEFGCNFGATSIVLGILGGIVTALDIDKDYITLAKANAGRYGVSEKIQFYHVEDTTRLPFRDHSFDFISCNSVLEYVPYDILGLVGKEIDRVLRPGGIILIDGTSNRLWPIEVHSRKWFVNYVPRGFDRLVSNNHSMQRGVFPWSVLSEFSGYINLDKLDGGTAYLRAKREMGVSGFKLQLLKIGNSFTSMFGIPIGMLTPSMVIPLKKTISESAFRDIRIHER